MAIKTKASKILAENLAPVYVLVGTDSYTKDKLSSKIKAKVEAKYGTCTSVILDAKETKEAEIIAEISSSGLFSSMGIVIIHRAELLLKTASFKTFLTEYNQREDIPNIVIIESEKERVLKNIKVMKADAPYDNQIASWIKNYLAESSKSISEDAANLVAFYCGRNLGNIVQELDKLITSYPEIDMYHLDEVKEVTGMHKNDDVFAYLNALLDGDLKLSLRLLQALMSFGTEPLQIVGILKWKLQQMITARVLMHKSLSEKEIISKMRLFPPFFYYGFCKKINRFSLKHLKDSYAILLETDLALKSTSQNSSLLLERFTVQLLSY